MHNRISLIEHTQETFKEVFSVHKTCLLFSFLSRDHLLGKFTDPGNAIVVKVFERTKSCRLLRFYSS